jgi:hypothetical protein
MIKEIAFVAYPSKDVAALRAWYEKHLDLTFGPAYTEGGVEQYAEAEIGDTALGLMNAEWVGIPAGSAAGLEVEDPYVTPVCKLASFHDLEGNKLTLHQRTATEWVAHD